MLFSSIWVLKMTVLAHFEEKSEKLSIIFSGNVLAHSNARNNSRWQLMTDAQMQYQLYFMKT